MGSPKRPVITLQVGNYANHVGAHWFNYQMNYFSSDREADRSIFWNERGIPGRQRILTPRVLLFDLDANWPRRTGMSEVGQLDETEPPQWDGTVSRYEESTPKKKKTERSLISGLWSDYMDWSLEGLEKVSFPISSFSYNSSIGVLSNYEQGEEIYKSIEERIVDGVRCYAENCDYLEGFNIIFDQDDGFGGVASGILSHLSDEYDKKCRLSIGVSPPSKPRWAEETKADLKHRLVNTALAWSACDSHSSLFTSLNLSNDYFSPNPQPRRLPHLNLTGCSYYESSALLAVALETLTAPYFSNTHPTGLADFVGLLSAYGRRMTCFGLSFPLLSDKSLFGTLQEHGPKIVQNLSSGTGSSLFDLKLDKALGNYFVIRGVPENKVISSTEKTPTLAGLQSSATCLDFFSREYCSSSLNVIRSVESQFNVSHPFPTQVVEQTFLSTQPNVKLRGKDCWNVAVLASAHNTPSPGLLLDRIVAEVSLNQVKACISTRNLEEDDYLARLEALRSLREAYNNES